MSFDAGLQPERTSLAWRRTGLVSVVATLALARAAVVRGSVAIAALCGVLVIAAAATLVEGSREIPAGEGRQAGTGPMQSLPRAAVVTVVVTALVGMAGFGLVVWT